MYLRIIVHANEHMGQLIAYARMTGVVPPWSEMKIQLRQIAHARSGDKGDDANIGLIALKPQDYPLLSARSRQSARRNTLLVYAAVK